MIVAYRLLASGQELRLQRPARSGGEGGGGGSGYCERAPSLTLWLSVPDHPRCQATASRRRWRPLRLHARTRDVVLVAAEVLGLRLRPEAAVAVHNQLPDDLQRGGQHATQTPHVVALAQTMHGPPAHAPHRAASLEKHAGALYGQASYGFLAAREPEERGQRSGTVCMRRLRVQIERVLA